MEKEFVPYNLSLRMKQLEFDEPCLKSYTKDGDFVTKMWQEVECDAPLYQQAFRWFRKNYYFLLHYDYGKVPHCTIIQKLILEDGLMTYEKAEFACLEKLIEIVEQSKSE